MQDYATKAIDILRGIGYGRNEQDLQEVAEHNSFLRLAQLAKMLDTTMSRTYATETASLVLALSWILYAELGDKWYSEVNRHFPQVGSPEELGFFLSTSMAEPIMGGVTDMVAGEYAIRLVGMMQIPGYGPTTASQVQFQGFTQFLNEAASFMEHLHKDFEESPVFNSFYQE